MPFRAWVTVNLLTLWKSRNPMKFIEKAWDNTKSECCADKRDEKLCMLMLMILWLFGCEDIVTFAV